jgi:hypothetical protein
MEAVLTSSSLPHNEPAKGSGAAVSSSQHSASDRALVRRLTDLFENRASGNMGPELYQNGGADLFAQLTLSVGYNPYAGEIALIEQYKGNVCAWAHDVETAIIIGPGPEGSVRNKELPILLGLPNLKRVDVIELSRVFNTQSSNLLRSELPNVEVVSHVKDFMRMGNSHQGDLPSSALVISTGSLTNYENCPTDRFPSHQLKSHLAAFRKLAGEGGKVLWGYDSYLSTEAYGNTLVSHFLLHPLKRAANVRGVEIDPSGFVHRSDCHQQASLVAHTWLATKDQTVTIEGEGHYISEGDRFMVFCSVKPCADKVVQVAKMVRLKTHMHKIEDRGAVLHAFDCV